MDLQIPDRPEIPLYRRIAGAVRDAVQAGRIGPGAKLPAQMTLARKLGVNPLTVSRGYELLASQGVVLQKRGSGTYVKADAVVRARSSGERTLRAVVLVVGQTSLSSCPRETVFIVTDIVDGIRDVLGARQVHIVFAESFTRSVLDNVTRDEGVLVFPRSVCDPMLLNELTQRDVPVLSIWEPGAPLSAPSVSYDRHQSATLACRHLVQAGYRSIGFIGRKFYKPFPVSPKFGAFTSVLHEAGLDILARHIRDVDREPGRAYAATRDMIAAGPMPRALFVDTDYKAMEVVAALQDASLRVPDDVAVVSYDDVPEAATFRPGLTTVRVPRRAIGRRAAEWLLHWSRNDPPPSIQLESELVVRESCGQSRAAPGNQEDPR
jgi:DNA-binding LacI/PurR family transcriptional regulator